MVNLKLKQHLKLQINCGVSFGFECSENLVGYINRWTIEKVRLSHRKDGYRCGVMAPKEGPGDITAVVGVPLEQPPPVPDGPRAPPVVKMHKPSIRQGPG